MKFIDFAQSSHYPIVWIVLFPFYWCINWGLQSFKLLAQTIKWQGQAMIQDDILFPKDMLFPLINLDAPTQLPKI